MSRVSWMSSGGYGGRRPSACGTTVWSTNARPVWSVRAGPSAGQSLEEREGASAGDVHGVDIREDLVEPVVLGSAHGDRDNLASERCDGRSRSGEDTARYPPFTTVGVPTPGPAAFRIVRHEIDDLTRTRGELGGVVTDADGTCRTVDVEVARGNPPRSVFGRHEHESGPLSVASSDLDDVARPDRQRRAFWDLVISSHQATGSPACDPPRELPHEDELKRHHDGQAEECERDARRTDAPAEHYHWQSDQQNSPCNDVPPRFDEPGGSTVRQLRAVRRIGAVPPR